MKKVRVVSKIYDNHSLAIVTRELCLQIIKNPAYDIDLTIVPLDDFNPDFKVSKEELKLIKPFIKKDIGEDIDIEVRHSYPPILAWPDNPKTKVIFIQPWEYNRMPLEWKYTFQDFADLVIVPSTWVQQVYYASGIRPDKIKVVPNGYDPEVFNKTKQPTSLLDGTKFNFVFVGNAQYRKGVDILLHAWHQAFVKADNAVLFIKDTPQIYGQNNLLENIVQLQYKSGCAKIIYNEDNLSKSEIASIYQNSSVIVHPYRGEGFGMHIQEAMACGCLPMVTGLGATDDFVTEENGIKLNARRQFIDANDQRFFIGKSGDSYSLMGLNFWVPEVDIGDLANKMKFLYFHHERNKILSKVNSAKLTTWSSAADKFVEVLQSLPSDTPAARIR